jgi:hypothetical protein
MLDLGQEDFEMNKIINGHQYGTDLYVIKIQKYVHMYVSIIYKIYVKNIQICKKKIELKKKNYNY